MLKVKHTDVCPGGRGRGGRHIQVVEGDEVSF